MKKKNTRSCYVCRREKSLDAFHRNRTKVLGREYRCKECFLQQRGKERMEKFFQERYELRKSHLGVRFNVLMRDKFACQYCGRRAPEVPLEVDHIVPRSKGGSLGIENLITSCFDCNRGKRDKII